MKDFELDFPKRAVEFSKSPLGIIALFIALVYSIAALVFSLKVNELVDIERLLLICFIIGFPVLVLIAFFILVTRYPNCLYPRSDFDSDEGYIRYQTSYERRFNLSEKVLQMGINDGEHEICSEQKERGKISQAGGTPKTAKNSNTANFNLIKDDLTPKVYQKAIGEETVQKMELARRIAYAEKLAFEDLKSRYKTSIKRHVVLDIGPNASGIDVDGYFTDKNSGKSFLVEIKYFQGKPNRNRLFECYLQALNKSLADVLEPPYLMILYIIIDDSDKSLIEEYTIEIEKFIKGAYDSITVIIKSLSDLEQRPI